MRYLLLLSIILCIGCTLSRSTVIKASGGNVSTIYGSGNADVEYKSNTTLGVLNGR